MTCAHCVAAVSEELQSIPGVTAVEVELVPAANSRVTVTSRQPIDEAAVAAAIDEAGYQLAQP
jgi:copper chaperone